MSDYLWDKTGEADPEIERLEHLLGALGHQPRRFELPPEADARAAVKFTRRTPPRAAWFAAAAALLLFVAGVAFLALRQEGLTGKSPLAQTEPPREATPAAVHTPEAQPDPTPAPPEREERAAGDDRRQRRGRAKTEVASRIRPQRKPPAAGATQEARTADEGRRLQAKEQLVYALRLTSATLEEVRRKVRGDAGAAPDERNPLR